MRISARTRSATALTYVQRVNRAIDHIVGRFVPDDQPAFEAWKGRPLAHGMEHFELAVQLPVRR